MMNLEFGTVKCTKTIDKALIEQICVPDFKNDIGFDDLASPKVQRSTVLILDRDIEPETENLQWIEILHSFLVCHPLAFLLIIV